ncbi:MAG: cadherin-like domain-containing protein [gamma proteobacterium symbiont of Lucinoma myriamae]|nr:cadherin-like domain-containing protein [gamma proteobacterium symbiont of Lucinoma myriamae]MCU7818755.1 cadherin-like domain-containing protein [gamma proteobacterium symbiont of Lucinoma myriamae]MCU7832593.1 cadherin-like domain-containing protein [gamma proteobacterium symbiont of Lucinoma myriamae]
MWLNIKWFNSEGTLLREDGEYGPIGVSIANPAGGPDVEVESIINLNDPNTRIYEAHYSMTKEWADVLLVTGKPADLALSYDRTTGAVDFTLGQLAAQAPGSYHETFHFALNNYVSKDNRIPPYGMRYDEAQKRNTLPVPAGQYGAGTASYNKLTDVYNYWDDVALNPPAGAASATIDLLYQGTSWEYIQFLNNANDQQNAFLGQEGVNMLEAWINAEVPVAMVVGDDRKMVPPVVMASTVWGTPGTGNSAPVALDDNYSTEQDSPLSIIASGVLSNDSDADADAMTAQLVSTSSNGSLTLNVDGSFNYSPDTGFNGSDSFTYQAKDTVGDLSNTATVLITVTATGGGTQTGVDSIVTGGITGKGKNKVFSESSIFSQGDTVIIRSVVKDSAGNPVADAIVTNGISGPETTTVTSLPSDADGIAQASWNTSSQNKRGNGGTATGNYTTTTTNVEATGFNWDGVATSSSFTIQ